MLSTRARGTAAVIAAALCFALLAGAGASSAAASGMSVWNEPAYTKGLSNSWYTEQIRSTDS